jgi:hypothetical protein
MKTWQPAVAACVTLMLIGCRADPYNAMLERDNRLKEDEIYRLRGRIEDLEETLQATAPSPARMVQPARIREAPPAEGPGSGPELTAPQELPEAASPTLPAPRRSVPARSAPEPARQSTQPAPTTAPAEKMPQSFTPPVIQMPKEAEPPNRIPPRIQVPDSSRGPSGSLSPNPASSGSTQWRNNRAGKGQEGPALEPPVEESVNSWRPPAVPAVGNSDRLAQRSDASDAARPVWSPERK